ncbi:MAG: ABC transporter substrate-binding protein [Spirochaetaceae bacterium]|nr:MAG: ABC transporter substrate-binding protein [Spirochaetaceae bacterium]
MVNKRIVLNVLLSILILLFPFSVFSGGSAEPEDAAKGPVTVASKIDTEGALLGSMIVQLLQQDGFDVVDNTEFGPTDVIRQAIISDEIDIYPEYTGNGAFFFDEAGDELWRDPVLAYERVRELDREANDIEWLTPAPANNTWAIAVRSDLADETGLTSLEDLADFVNRGGDIRLAASEEFVTRPDVLPAFEEAYEFSLDSENLVVFSGGNTAMTIRAAAQQTDGVNTAMAYGTDGELAALGLRVLTDTLGVQPVYEPAPIVRSSVLEQYPEIESILAPVFEALSLETLQTLNSQIAIEGRAASDVASTWLRASGFLD